MHLLDKYPYRFGWRIWYVLPRIGRLVTPVEAIMLTGHTLDAQCETWHTPPALALTCGIHFWPELAITDAYSHHDPPIAVTFGAALGPITPDHVDTSAMRSRRYRILATFLPTNLETLAATISQHHGVPVHTGISQSVCRAAAIEAVPNRGPDWFTELANEPTPNPDNATQHYNQAITSTRRTRPPLDSDLADNIQAAFERGQTELVGRLQ